jgi:sterol desaturase/sphingolipid hydroxylase (fatty acid hydroxylase superfamily)
MSIFWLIENAVPLFTHSYKKWSHARTNFVFLAITMIINSIFALATVNIIDWLNFNNIGLLNWVALPLWTQLLVSLLLLDLIAQYTVHFLLHKVKFMWKLHMVHHSDTHVDVTTGTRHHPIDYIMREVFALLAIIVGGIPFGCYVFYKITTVFFTYFSHANYSLPRSMEKFVAYLFITPDMHKFHHHFERPWTDSNFGNIFSIWDRIFGTMVQDDVSKINYGLDVLPNEKSNELGYQMLLPFDSSIKTDY